MRLQRLKTTIGISLVIFAIVVGMVIATGTITNYFNSQQANLMTTYAKQTIVQTAANNAAQTPQEVQSVQTSVPSDQQNTAGQNAQNSRSANQNTPATVSQPAPQPAPVIIQTRRTRAS